VISSKFKSSNTDDSAEYSLDDENHVLKSLKYEGTDSLLTTPDYSRSNSHESLQHDQLPLNLNTASSGRISKSTSIPSLVAYRSNSIGAKVETQPRSHSLVDIDMTGSLKTSPVVEDSIKLLRKNSAEVNGSDDLEFRDEEKLLPAMVEPFNTVVETATISNSSNLSAPFSAQESSVNRADQEVLIFFKNQFNQSKELSFSMLSPPISPSRQKSIFQDPLSEIKEECTEVESLKIEEDITGVDDFADAMALSILDKVDDEAASSEWKIY
jgi:hypothetical protein